MIEFKPRFFVLPAIALAVIAMLHGAADGGCSTSKRGATMPIVDPAIRASFEAFQLSQSVSLATTIPDLGQISDNKQEGKSDAFHGDCQGEQRF
jgi:hypothetical protein